MKTLLLNPLADPTWLRMLGRAMAVTIFHHPLWMHLLRECYGYSFTALTVTDKDGRPVAGLPLAQVSSRLTGRRLVAMPFADACGPVVAPDAPPDTLERLARALSDAQAEHGGRLEVRDLLPGAGDPVELFHRHVIDLSDGAEAASKRFHSRVRRHTRKALREGVTVERRIDREGLDTFYALHLQTRRRLGVPTQPKSFVRRLEPMMAAGLGYVAVAKHEGNPIAAAVFLGSGDTLLYKYGASDQAAWGLRPNNALFDQVIRWAADDGVQALDLGRTDLGHEGLRDFKLSWGADETPLSYTYLGGAAGGPGGGRAGKAMSAVIRKGPPVTGRAIGGLLYRHAG